MLACVSACIAVSVARADDTAWGDIESRIQYGFYTEDTRLLQDMADQLSGPESEEQPLRDYYGALANYRLALLVAKRDRQRAREAIEHCVDQLNAALKRDEGFVAGLALQAACLSTLASLKPWWPFASSKSAGQMQRAVKLAPHDPRVLLLLAMRKGIDAHIDDASLGRLQSAIAAFEAERQGVRPLPGWGAAEAYAYLGRGYLERGDVLKARDALERALLIAPDFALAKRLLSQITAG